MKKLLLALILPASLLLIWQAASVAGLLSPAYFPAPSRSLDALSRSIATGALWGPLASTLLRMFEGWMLASLLGIVLGSLIGLSANMRAYLNPFLEFVRPFPASAIIPPAIMIFGLTNQMAILVIAFGAIWPVLLGTLHGIASVEPRLREVALSLNLKPSDYLFKMAIPSAMPDIFTGVRISLAVSLILAVVVEMQAAQPGLGQNILLAQRMFRSPDLYAGIFVLGFFGFLINRLLDLAERRLLIWRA